MHITHMIASAAAIVALAFAAPLDKTCTCMIPGPGKARFLYPGTCASHDPQYEKLCETDTDEFDCEQQTLVKCYWRPHPCTTSEDCTNLCPPPPAAPMCM